MRTYDNALRMQSTLLIQVCFSCIRRQVKPVTTSSPSVDIKNLFAAFLPVTSMMCSRECILIVPYSKIASIAWAKIIQNKFELPQRHSKRFVHFRFFGNFLGRILLLHLHLPWTDSLLRRYFAIIYQNVADASAGQSPSMDIESNSVTLKD